MDDEIHTFTGRHAYLEEAPGVVGTDQHDEIVRIEDADRVAVGVEHVVVADPVFAGARQDHGVHGINLA